MIGRRQLLRWLAAGFSPACLLAGVPPVVRPYRADAVITLGSLPLYRRRGVGSGYAVCRRLDGPSGPVWLLGFAGGSWPDRAAGVNRLGYYCELAPEDVSGGPDCRYFGFLSASDERDLAEARRNLDAGGDMNWFSVIESRLGRAPFCRTARFPAPAALAWPQWPPLLERAQEAIRAQKATCQDAERLPSFLRALLAAVRSPEQELVQLFCFSGRVYRLETRKRPAPRLSERLGRPVAVLAGTVQRLNTGSRSRFQLWLGQDDDAGPPLRIELRPRPFLRLAFDYDPAVLERDGAAHVPFLDPLQALAP